jgi:biopolymer transport protein ExbB/TolQ
MVSTVPTGRTYAAETLVSPAMNRWAIVRCPSGASDNTQKWWLVLGVFLVLGPLWGTLGTVVGMVRSFNAIAGSQSPRPEQLAADISTALYATMAGLVVCPIGIVIIVVYAIRCSRVRSDAPRE